MPITVSAVIVNTAKAKTFEVTVPEADAVAVDNVIIYTASGMTSFDDTPNVKIVTPVTLAAAGPTDTSTIGISNMTPNGFNVCKTSVAGAGVIHTYRITFLSRQFYEV